MMKSRRIKWAGQVAHTGRRGMHTGKSTGVNTKLGRQTRSLEDNVTINLAEIGLVIWTGFIWLKIGTTGGTL
jgi:hypothetical protein